jgi:hypothetical protein
MNKGLMILKWTVVCLLFVFLFGWVTMLLWNWLVPVIFDGPVISFWQALGLLVLSKILLGFGGKGWGGHSGNARHWKQGYYKKLAGMTPEEREHFKTRMREKWCYRDKSTSTGNQDISND